MKCREHNTKEATALCISCGKPVCEECLVASKDESYCKGCISDRAEGVSVQERSPVLAAIMSFIIAGSGQLYNGQVGKGLLIFFTAWLIIPWIYGIFDAHATAKKINEGEIMPETSSGCVIAGFCVILIVPVFVFFIFMLAAIAIPNFIKARNNAMQTKELYSSPQMFVDDSAGVMTPADNAQLAEMAFQIQRETGARVKFITVRNTGTKSVDDYVNAAYAEWDSSGMPRGTAIVIFLSMEDKKVMIKVGPAFRGIITDAFAQSVVNNVLIPEFSGGRISQGFATAAREMANRIKIARLTGAE